MFETFTLSLQQSQPHVVTAGLAVVPVNGSTVHHQGQLHIQCAALCSARGLLCHHANLLLGIGSSSFSNLLIWPPLGKSQVLPSLHAAEPSNGRLSQWFAAPGFPRWDSPVMHQPWDSTTPSQVTRFFEGFMKCLTTKSCTHFLLTMYPWWSHLSRLLVESTP